MTEKRIVSWVFDGDGNKVERFEDDTLRVTLSGRGRRTEGEVKAWYWRAVSHPRTIPTMAPEESAHRGADYCIGQHEGV